MRMRRRGDARPSVCGSSFANAPAGIPIVCRGDLYSVRVFGKKAAERPGQIYPLVILAVSAGGNRNWLADVPVFAVDTDAIREESARIDSLFLRMLS